MTQRRRRASSEEKQERLLALTEEIMLADGYAAVTSRSVAAAAGINPSLLHYYFPTIDDLFVAVLARRSDKVVERMEQALTTDRPLLAWWEVATDPRSAAFFLELLAATNHRPALKAEVGELARRVRAVQMEALDRLLPEYGLDDEQFPPALVAAAIQGVAFGLTQDRAAGFETHHGEALDAAQALILRLEEARAGRRGTP
jgi:AcrR family transcriptional regulator